MTGYLGNFPDRVSGKFPRYLGIWEISQIPGHLGNSPNAWVSWKFPVIWEISNILKINHPQTQGRTYYFEFCALEKYHYVYQIIGFNWVWFAFSTHFWDLQTQSKKGFIQYLSVFTLFYILHYSHSFYINNKDL